MLVQPQLKLYIASFEISNHLQPEEANQGLIDFLIHFGLRKQAEHLLRAAQGHGHDTSCVDPADYAARQAGELGDAEWSHTDHYAGTGFGDYMWLLDTVPYRVLAVRIILAWMMHVGCLLSDLSAS